MQAISQNIRKGLPWEALYADDLVIIVESEAELKDRLQSWKNVLESKGLRAVFLHWILRYIKLIIIINNNKTKVMCSQNGRGSICKQGDWPCGVCGKNVQSNAIKCKKCIVYLLI